nr:uncharacterized protein LOC111425513 [Onthophagus taurus]
MLKFFVFFVILFHFTRANLVHSNSCSRYCKDTKNSFNYKIGYTYEYKYTGIINSLVYKNTSNAKSDEFQIDLEIDVLSPCDFEMKIISFQRKNDGNKIFEESLKKNPLKFSFQNGKIVTVCPTIDETTPILNLKRGILSSFQTSRDKGVFFETDVSGICKTNYEITSDLNSNKIVKKIRDLTSCNKRSIKQFSWQSEIYNKNQAKFSSPLLKSTQNCQQIIRNNQIYNVDCVEKHLFRPFSNEENGASIILTQQLRFKKSYNKLNNQRKRIEFLYSSLIFEKENKLIKNPSGDIEKFQEIMEEIDEKLKNGLGKDVVELFSGLVNLLETPDQKFLIEAFEEVKESKTKRKFFIDAISVVKTIESVEVIKKLNKNQEISHQLVNSWLTSLGFIKNPQKELIYSLKEFLNDEEYLIPTKQTAFLTISRLIHQYCKDNNCEDEFKEIFELISKPISQNCVPDSVEHQDNILLALKSIGNTGNEYFLRYLQKCYKNINVPIDLKVASIQAHRRINCNKNKNIEDFEEIFSNFEENSELRIISYLGMMRCSSYSTLEKIKYVLNEEETNQVGSFVWSHLVNLQKTESYWKQNLKKLVENDDLKHKFSTDPRKYSRNYEFSTFLDEIDTGVGVESNLIFSQDSYLPKSGFLNFTIDIFGEAINLFEIGARIEGFEEIVENIFGPNGYFPEKSIKTFLENQRSEHETNLLNIQNNHHTLKKSPNGLFYTKIFGDEINFNKFQNLEGIFGKPNDIYSFLHALTSLLKDIEFSKSLKFLDSKLEIPTILGFPLELSSNGTAVLGLTTSGKINIKDLKNYKFDLEGKISPSASVKIEGNMKIDSYFTKIGLKTVSTLNSNVLIDGFLKIDKGNLIDVKINAPKNHIDLFNIESSIFLIKGDKIEEIDDISSEGVDRNDCTGTNFEEIIGLKLCHQIKYVNASQYIDAPYFPLTGKFKYAITAQKNDSFNSYIFKFTSQRDDKQGIYGFTLDLDRPNSKINRKLSSHFLLNIPEKRIGLKMLSNKISFDLLGSIQQNDPKKLTFSLKHTYNKEEIFDVEATLNHQAPKYDVNIHLNYKKNQLFLLKGNLNKKLDEFTSSFQVNIKKNHYIFDSTLKIKDNSYILTSIIKDGDNTTKGDIKINLIYDINHLSMDFNTNYKGETISLILKTFKQTTYDMLKHGFYLKLNSSINPNYNGLINIETRKAYFFYDLQGNVDVFGKKWKTTQFLQFFKEDDVVDAAIISSLNCQEKNIDYVFELSHYKANHKDLGKFLIQFNQIQKLEASYKIEEKNRNTYLLIFVYFPINTYTIKSEIINTSEAEYKINLIGEKQIITKETFLIVNGVYLKSPINNLQNYSFTGNFDLNNGIFTTPWSFTLNFQTSDDLLLTNLHAQTPIHEFSTQLLWNHNSFNTNFEFNKAKKFFTNIKWNHEVQFAMGLNIYQNFELNITFQPKTKLDVLFYWNKDRDLKKKLYLNLHNFGGGIYSMEFEYPNQKVTVSFTLQSTQIILNITWGLETYQKIYLNVGSKVYDLGGIWYGELETPFKYFEKQQFNIKYLIMQNHVDVEIKVFWREHQINFMLSGSRSSNHIIGKLEMKTTMPEIYNVGFGVSHVVNNKLENIEKLEKIDKITNISMIYNEHQVNCFNIWTKTGMNVDGKFELTSPTKTLNPIIGNLEIKNNETNSQMNSLLNWQGHKIIINYEVEKSKSFILIKTPFKDILMEIEIDILNKLNYLLLHWSNENNKTYNVEFEIISPMTGKYQLFFKHSTYYGYLMENLIINHGKNNNTIFGIQLNGNLISIWEVDLHWSMRFLNHNATLIIKNNFNNFSEYASKMLGIWDNLTISSDLEINFNNKSFWRLKSSALKKEFYCFYHKNDDIYNFGVTINDILNGEIKFKFYDLLNIDVTFKDYDIKFKYFLVNNLYKKNEIEIFYQFNNYTIKGDVKLDLKLNDFLIKAYFIGSDLAPLEFYGEGNKDEKSFYFKVESDILRGSASLNMNQQLFSMNLSAQLLETQLVLKINVDDVIFEMIFKSNFDNVYLNIEKDGLITFRKNNETIILNYKLNELIFDDDKINFDVILTSSLNLLNNTILIINLDRNKIYFKLNFDVYKVEIDYVFRFNRELDQFESENKVLIFLGVADKNVTNINFDVKTNFKNHNNETSFTLNFIENKSKLDIELFKKNWDEIKLKCFSVFNENVFAETIFSYKVVGVIFFESKSIFGDVNFRVDVGDYEADESRRVVTNISYKKDDVEYSGKMLTKYKNIFWSDSEVELKFNETYLGNFKIEFDYVKNNKINNTLMILLRSPTHLNKIDCVLNVDTIKKVNGVFDFYLGVFNASSKLEFEYDLEVDKKIGVNYDSDVVKLQLGVNKGDVKIKLDLPNNEKFFYVNGQNVFNDNEVVLNYYVKYSTSVLNFNVFYINKNYTQSKLEMSSNIKGYERVIFENRIDDNKIRIFMYSKLHKLSLIADKTALSQDKELFSIYYNGDPIVVIRSDNDQSYLMTSSKYINYKLTINYVHQPAIYTFSILKNGENLISFMLLNTTSTNLIGFKGKLAAPILFKNYPEILFNLNINQDVSKLFHIHISSENKNLFEIKWTSKLENGLYQAYFKYASDISLGKLKRFEIQPSLNMWNDLSIKINYHDNNKYFIELVIPIKTLDTKFLIEYPCLDYQCKYYFYINRTLIDIDWEGFNKLKLLINLENKQILFENNDNYLKGGFIYNETETILIYIKSNLIQNEQKFFYKNKIDEKTLKINLNSSQYLIEYKLDADSNKNFNLNFNEMINLTGFVSNDFINFVLNNTVTLTNLTFTYIDENIYFNIKNEFIPNTPSARDYSNDLFYYLFEFSKIINIPILEKEIIFESNNFNDSKLIIKNKNDTDEYIIKKTQSNLLIFNKNLNISFAFDDSKGYFRQLIVKNFNGALNLTLGVKNDLVESKLLIDDLLGLKLNFQFDLKKSNKLFYQIYLIYHFENTNFNLSLNVSSHKNDVSINMKSSFPGYHEISFEGKMIPINSTYQLDMVSNNKNITLNLLLDADFNPKNIKIDFDTNKSAEIYIDLYRESYFKTNDLFIQYNINNKYLFKLIYSEIIFEFIHENNEGELFIELPQKSQKLELSYKLWDHFKLNNPQNISIYLSKNQINIIKNEIEITYINNFTTFCLKYKNKNLLYLLELFKNTKNFNFQFNDYSKIVYNLNNDHKLLIFNFKNLIDSKFNSSKTLIEFKAIIPKLNDVILHGKLNRSKLFAETIFKYQQNNESLIAFNEYHDSTKMGIVFNLHHLYIKLNHEYQNSKITFHLKNNFNEIVYEFSDLTNLNFTIKNINIINNGFSISTSIHLLPLNVTFQIYSFNNLFTKFICYANKNSFYLNFIAPQNQILNLIQFETIWGHQIFKTLNKIQIESKQIGNVSIIGNFDLKKDGLDIETHLKIPFLDHFNELDGEVHIHKNLAPFCNFYINLPNKINYSVKAIYLNDLNTFTINVDFNQIYSGKIDYKKNNSFIYFNVITPFEGYKNYSVEFNKYDKSKLVILNLNERIYCLNVLNNINIFSVNLKTPFKNYENYLFSTEIDGNNFSVFVFYPGVKRAVGFGVNYVFDLNQLGFGVKISLPYKINNFEYSSLAIKIIKTENNFNISTLSELNDRFLELNLLINSQFYSRIKTNNHSIIYQLNKNDLENYLIYDNKSIYHFNFNKDVIKFEFFDCYGFHFITNGSNSINFQVGFYLPQKKIVLAQNYFKNSTYFVYDGNLLLNDQKLYQIQTDLTQKKGFDFDFNLNLNSNFSKLRYNVVLNKRHVESKFFINGLTHDIIFRIDFSKLEIPFIFVLELEYSGDKDKMVHLEIFYNKTYIDNETIDERRLILRHPHSRLDHAFISKTITSNEYIKINAIIEYKNFAEDTPDYMKISFDIGRKEFEITTKVESKKNSLFIFGKSLTEVYSKGLQINFKINNKEPLNLNYLYVFKEDSPSFQFLIGYGERFYQLFMGIPNNKEIRAELIHNVYGKETIDGLIILKLNTTSLLWTKIIWNFNVHHEFDKIIVDEYKDLKYIIQTIGKQLIDILNDETGKIILNEYKAIKKNIKFKINFPKKFEKIQKALESINLIHINEINIKKIKEIGKNLLNKSLEDVKLSLNDMKKLTKSLSNDFINYLTKIKRSFLTIFQPLINLINESSIYFEQQKTYINVIFVETIFSIEMYVYQLREVNEMISVFVKLKSWVSSINYIEFFNPLWDVLEITINIFVTNLNQFIDEYIPFSRELKSYLQMITPKIREIKEFIDASCQKIIWFWNYYDVSGNIKSYVWMRTSYYSQLFIHNTFGSTKEGFGIFDYIYQPENGMLEITQRLPVEWESFDKSPQFEQHPLYNHIYKKISLLTLDQLEHVLSKIQILIYTILHTTIKPPINNYAMLIADNHFITFNNKHFHLNPSKSNCSYLLINNFDTNSFSVILNSKNVNSTLSITTHNNSITFNTFKEEPILFNSNPVEFPLIKNDFYIQREEENIIFENNQGLFINCNMHHHYCTFKVSEWLFGKINGMLGTMDNEQNTDIRKPNGSSIIDIDDFAQSWRVEQCLSDKIKINNTKIPTFVNNAMNLICSLTFSTSNSTLSSCFPIIDPKPFYEMCLKRIRINSNSVCSSIAVYKQLCNYKHIQVKMPHFCANCNLNNNEQIFDGHNPKTTDIVFIQEENCRANTQELTKTLNQALIKKGFSQNRFAFVVYKKKSFIETVQGKIWINDTNLIQNQSIKLINQENQQNQEFLSKLEETLRYSSKLEFRLAVKKLFILIQCESCSEISHSQELFNLLGEKDIILHIVKPHPFENQNYLAFDSQKSRIDNHGVLKEIESNEKMIDSLKDMCCGLALSTSGTVSKAVLLEKYQEKWAELVAGTLRESSCQKCRCIQKGNGVGKIDCNRCMSPLVKQLLNEYESQHVRL